ncbi:MAG: phosphoenolpyruvate carboxylase [Thermodesulfobacteria bacterium]|nr:phosphoenolpyruvate carboxylase [Thermodesulfobacteriota bacterium]
MLKKIFNEIIREKGKPFLPADAVRFQPVDSHVDVQELFEHLRLHLGHFRQVTEENPFANPILLLSVYLARWIERGKLTFSAIEQLIQYLDSRAFVSRAERLHRYVGKVDPVENLRSIESFLSQIPGGKDGSDAFEAFSTQVGREIFGIVITAHPTFALREDLLRILSELASGRNMAGAALSEEQIRELLIKALRCEHLSDPDIDLEKEHRLALEAIENLQRALGRLYDLVFKLSKELFPDSWWKVRPRIITLASWVGYDLDGRRDIAWPQTFAFRLQERKLALEKYARSIQTIIDLCPIEDESEELRGILAKVLRILMENVSELSEEISVFQAISLRDEEGLESLKAISRKMFSRLSTRLTSPGTLVELVDKAVEQAEKYEEIRHRLCLLSTEIANYGLGVSHIHVRLNAKQIHNAIRGLIGMETDPEDPSSKQTYLKAVDQLLGGVRPVSINFGSIMAERTTAKRLFMLVSQILKYADSETPIRFLIAETESPFTCLAALYFARLFGVDEKIDISPLFETPRALSKGARIIKELLSNEYYLEYVKKRGRLCVQTGFSDAGRHLGQTAASFAIESFRRQLAEVLEGFGLGGIELVIFNTHGESIGRGAHPADFHSRLAYVMSPRSRAELKASGVNVKEELSFQGGDGYVYFMNPSLALAVLARLLEFSSKADRGEDPFYQEWDYVFEFFATIRQFNERIMADPDYGVLLNDYGKYLLYPTGSRSVRREFEIKKVPTVSAAQIRAIPQNAILHQLGLLANTIGGVGMAIKKNPEQFSCLQQQSERFNLLLSVAEYGLSFSDFYAFMGYLNIIDPGFWLMAAAKAANSQHAHELIKVADFLEHSVRHADFARVGRIFYRDLLDLTEIMGELHCQDEQHGIFPYSRDGLWMDNEMRDHLEILHAVRLTLIYQIFTLAVQVPEFSPQAGITRDEVIERILHLDVESAVGVLKKIFPLLESQEETQDFGERATYQTEQYLGYFQEHQNIFNPMESLYRLIQRISGGNTHIIGAFG